MDLDSEHVAVCPKNLGVPFGVVARIVAVVGDGQINKRALAYLGSGACVALRCGCDMI